MTKEIFRQSIFVNWKFVDWGIREHGAVLHLWAFAVCCGTTFSWLVVWHQNTPHAFRYTLTRSHLKGRFSSPPTHAPLKGRILCIAENGRFFIDHRPSTIYSLPDTRYFLPSTNYHLLRQPVNEKDGCKCSGCDC